MEAVMWAPMTPPRAVVAPKAATPVVGSPVIRKAAPAAVFPASKPILSGFFPVNAKGLEARTPCSLPKATAEPAMLQSNHQISVVHMHLVIISFSV